MRFAVTDQVTLSLGYSLLYWNRIQCPGDSYNARLSEARATTVRDWMAGQGLIPAGTPIKGFGKSKPAVPNTTADGQDDPDGRQKNRRVEVVFDTCK